MNISFILLTLLVLSVTSKLCLETFSSATTYPHWSRPAPADALKNIKMWMNEWLDSHPDIVLISSSLTRSDDDVLTYYTGYFLYQCEVVSGVIHDEKICLNERESY